MAVNIAGSATAGNANVTNNHLQVVNPLTEADAGFVTLSSEVDSGSITTERLQRALEVSPDFRLRVGSDTTLFNLSFEGTNQPQALLQTAVATMSISQASGFYILNNTNQTTTGIHAITRTYRCFPVFGTYPLFVEMWLREAGTSETNVVSEWGLGYVATTSAPTDGIFFRRLSGGQLRCVLNFNGTETELTVDPTNVPGRDGSGLFSPTECNHYLIAIHNDDVSFWINDIIVGHINCPSAQGNPSSSSQLPLFGRVYTSGTASGARRLEFGFLNVTLGDMDSNKPWSHSMSGMGGGSYQIQIGNASGPNVTRGAGSTGWPTSATARAAGTWTATSAPATNSLGGIWVSPAISTLTSEADYPVFAYLNPSGTSNLPGKTLYITGIRVGETAVIAAASTNAITLSYAAGVGSTAVNTSTADSATALGPRIIPLGQVSFPSTAAAGSFVSGWQVDFSHGPLVVPPNTYLHFIVRPFGTVTSNTLTVTGMVTFIGYYE